MKLSIILVSLAIIIFSCGNEGGKPSPKVSKRDTTITLAAYLGYKLVGLNYGLARKISIDTLTWVGKDSATMKKEWTKLVYYEVEVSIPINDSISAKTMGLKWNGKDTVVRRLLQADAKYVVDGITNWDSATAKLKPYMDTTVLKKDTAK